MTTKTKHMLPGWTFKVDEFSPGVYRITMTDPDGRKAEIVDDCNDATVDKCIGYAFDIEKQTKRNWNKFLFDFSNLKLADVKTEVTSITTMFSARGQFRQRTSDFYWMEKRDG